MTEILTQHEEIHESETNREGVYDITTFDEVGEEKFEFLNPDRLYQMSQEIVVGGAIDSLLERLAAVKAEAEKELIKVQAFMRPLEKVQKQHSSKIAEIVAQIAAAGAAVGISGGSGEEITELATRLIEVNKQLADISQEIATYQGDESRQISRIEQCVNSVNDVVGYREGCAADLDAARLLNASMRSKPGLGMLVPESLLISSEQQPAADQHYLRSLGEAAGKIVEYQLPKSVTDYTPTHIEKVVVPPKREPLSSAPLNIGSGGMVRSLFRKEAR